MVRNLFSSILRIFGLLALLALILIVIPKLLPESARTALPASPNNAYPPPVYTPTNASYPPPQNSQPTQIIPWFPYLRQHFDPYLFSSPAQATAFYTYMHRTPSPSEVAAQSTYIAQRANIATQISVDKKIGIPDYQSPSYPVKSEADLPNVLYNDIPMYTSDINFKCFSAKNTGSSLLVHSLDTTRPDYYLVPFYKDNKVCALAMINVVNGFGMYLEQAVFLEDSYPQVTANEAINLVEQKTGLKVVGRPALTYQLINEDTDPFSPFWNVQTSDGQYYYVIFLVGLSEDGSINKHVTVINAKDATILH